MEKQIMKHPYVHRRATKTLMAKYPEFQKGWLLSSSKERKEIEHIATILSIRLDIPVIHSYELIGAIGRYLVK